MFSRNGVLELSTPMLQKHLTAFATGVIEARLAKLYSSNGSASTPAIDKLMFDEIL